MMDWHDGSYGSGGWVAIAVTMVLACALLSALVVWIVIMVRRPRTDGRAPDRAPTPADTGNRAESLLAERFARGEIDTDQFVSQRAHLRG